MYHADDPRSLCPIAANAVASGDAAVAVEDCKGNLLRGTTAKLFETGIRLDCAKVVHADKGRVLHYDGTMEDIAESRREE